MVLAGTGKEGKTKEVVKDREGKTVGMYVCMCVYVCMYVRTYVRMYVCMYVCTYGTRPHRNGHCSNTKRYKT